MPLLPPPPMTVCITTESNGTVTAFLDNELVMNYGQPTISTYLRINDMERWMTTLEEVMILSDARAHRYDLEKIYFALKATVKRHTENHLEVVSEAPTADDLQEYLSAYAAAAANHGL